jgi:hypothetical protein
MKVNGSSRQQLPIGELFVMSLRYEHSCFGDHQGENP